MFPLETGTYRVLCATRYTAGVNHNPLNVRRLNATGADQGDSYFNNGVAAGTGSWESMCGQNADLTFESQGTYVIEVGTDKYVFVADRWRPKNPVDGTYVWLPIGFQKGLPALCWKTKWNFSDWLLE